LIKLSQSKAKKSKHNKKLNLISATPFRTFRVSSVDSAVYSVVAPAAAPPPLLLPSYSFYLGEVLSNAWGIG